MGERQRIPAKLSANLARTLRLAVPRDRPASCPRGHGQSTQIMELIMRDQNGKASAAHIKIKSRPVNLFERLQRLVTDSGTDRNHQAIVAITVCIGERVDTLKAICEVMARLGFKTSHVAAILKTSTGSDPARHHWSKNEAGHYHLLT
jgi:hypothetical protein